MRKGLDIGFWGIGKRILTCLAQVMFSNRAQTQIASLEVQSRNILVEAGVLAGAACMCTCVI